MGQIEKLFSTRIGIVQMEYHMTLVNVHFFLDHGMHGGLGLVVPKTLLLQLSVKKRNSLLLHGQQVNFYLHRIMIIVLCNFGFLPLFLTTSLGCSY
jgi:hypothetical protein